MLQLNNTSRLILIVGRDLIVLVSIYYWKNKVSLWVWIWVAPEQKQSFATSKPNQSSQDAPGCTVCSKFSKEKFQLEYI